MSAPKLNDMTHVALALSKQLEKKKRVEQSLTKWREVLRLLRFNTTRTACSKESGFN